MVNTPQPPEILYGRSRTPSVSSPTHSASGSPSNLRTVAALQDAPPPASTFVTRLEPGSWREPIRRPQPLPPEVVAGVTDALESAHPLPKSQSFASKAVPSSTLRTAVAASRKSIGAHSGDVDRRSS